MPFGLQRHMNKSMDILPEMLRVTMQMYILIRIIKVFRIILIMDTGL